MMNYFVFDDTDSRTFNTYIATSNMFDAPEAEVETVSIPGSNNIVYFSKGNYKPFTIKTYCYIPSNMQVKVDELRQWLKSLDKPCKYIEALRPNEYRIARYIEAYEVKTSDRQSAAFELKFSSRPERFLTSGDEQITMNSSGNITNPTAYDSKPIIRVTGTGSFTVGDYEITVNTNSNYIDINCETMQCYCGDTNCNNNVELDDFPILRPGANAITLSGVRLVITPKWWVL